MSIQKDADTSSLEAAKSKEVNTDDGNEAEGTKFVISAVNADAGGGGSEDSASPSPAATATATTPTPTDDSRSTSISSSNNGSLQPSQTSNSSSGSTQPAQMQRLRTPGAFAVRPLNTVGTHQPPDDDNLQDADVDIAAEAEAYTVEDLTRAEVVQTVWGVDKKKLIKISTSIVISVSIILAIVLGVLIPRSNNKETVTASSSADVCGPLCGEETPSVPFPRKKMLGKFCEDWNQISKASLINETERGCEAAYAAASYGCECPDVEIPLAASCGKLCSDGSDISSDKKNEMVTDIHGTKLTCSEWEIQSMFDTREEECVNYNAIGTLCGCYTNKLHPDACGHLCWNDDETMSCNLIDEVWGMTCSEWNILSSYLPIWYNNEGGETCEEYWQDVAYACGCSDIPKPSMDCRTLCQSHRLCPGLCWDGSDIPDPDLIARRDTCLNWERTARHEQKEFYCPLYYIAGSMCGCENNLPPEGACGPLCSGVDYRGNSLPAPNKIVLGQSCYEWNYISSYLTADVASTGTDVLGGASCDDFFNVISYGCECPDVSLPSDSCGYLCEDGSSVLYPDLVVVGKFCGDIERESLYARNTDSFKCDAFKAYGLECGCNSTTLSSQPSTECFKYEYLYNITVQHFESSIADGGSMFRFTFGENGSVEQMYNSFEHATTNGYFSRIVNGTAFFGGGV